MIHWWQCVKHLAIHSVNLYKCMHSYNRKSKTMVVIMMALKNKTRTELQQPVMITKMRTQNNSTPTCIYAHDEIKRAEKAIFQQAKRLIQLIDCVFMCFKMVFSSFNEHCLCIRISFRRPSNKSAHNVPNGGNVCMCRYIDQWSLFMPSLKCKLVVLFCRINNQ